MLARVVDVIPNYKVIFEVAHFAYGVKLVIEPFAYFGRYYLIFLFKPLFAKHFKVFVGSHSVRRSIPRDERNVAHGFAFFVELYAIAAALFGYFHGYVERFGQIGKHFFHLLAAFQIKFVGIEFHMLGVVERGLRVDAHHYFLHQRVVLG